MKYKQLTLKERYHISTLLQRGYTQKEIAEHIGVHPSTISREIRRNWDGCTNRYEYTTAHFNTKQRHQCKPKYTVINQRVEKYIRIKLKEGWSPEQIAGRMQYEGIGSISHETIYQFVYRNKAKGGRLYKHLRHKHRKYHKRGNSYKQRGIILDRVMIEQRPKIVEKKKRIGDLEIDTVIGKDHRGALVTAVDRKSKFTLIKQVPSKHARIVTHALIEMLEPIKPIIKTITSDNGKEFAYHKEVSEILDTDFYFANPYHSWERGLNEHTNGLIRQYLPKKTDLTQVCKEEVITIQESLNHRPRKVLGFRTPYEVFFEEFVKELAA
jgi:IS30 family transposase